MNTQHKHPFPSHSDGAIDEFESIFKRAERTPYQFSDLPLGSITVVTDGDRQTADTLTLDIKRFFPYIANTAQWNIVTGDQFHNVNDLLRVLDGSKPDLIVTSRCLGESSLVPQHTLGVYVDVMTQTLSTPLLLLPGTAPQPRSLADTTCSRVMVVTDNLTGDDRLVNRAVSFCDPNGTLWLCHVEDDLLFRRYLDAIRRIPQINTEQAQELITEQLVAIPTHYAESCRKGLREAGVDLTVEQIVEFGHRVARYRDLVARHSVDLLVTNTKDQDQLAMHGMAYALSVELTEVTQLLL